MPNIACVEYIFGLMEGTLMVWEWNASNGVSYRKGLLRTKIPNSPLNLGVSDHHLVVRSKKPGPNSKQVHMQLGRAVTLATGMALTGNDVKVCISGRQECAQAKVAHIECKS